MNDLSVRWAPTNNLVTGNPGIGLMYEDFMVGLDKALETQTDIWTFSYLGHHTQNPPFLPTGKQA